MYKPVAKVSTLTLLAFLGLVVAQVAASSPPCESKSKRRSSFCAPTTSSTTSASDAEAPSAPLDLVTKASTQTTAALSWSASTDNRGVVGYEVYVNDTLADSTSAVEYVVTAVLCGTTYTFGVRAFDAAGNRSARSRVTGSTARCAVTPTDLLPYDPGAAWNTPLPANPTVDPNSAKYINAIADNGLPLTSDPDQYTYPVWISNASTPKYSVRLSGYFSSYDAGDNSKVSYGFAPTISGVPVSAGSIASMGTDGQIVFWDPTTGVEYGFYQWSGNPATGFTATYGYRYHTTRGYYGRFVDGGTSSRGAGTSYLAGLVRKWEIDAGHIDHALTFAYHSPSNGYVYPASKSDGSGVLGIDVPEGARLQLNPALTDSQLVAYNVNAPGLVIAHALQRYGAFVVDHSGSSKIYLEDRASAAWDGTINRSMLSGIPWSQFRVVRP